MKKLLGILLLISSVASGQTDIPFGKTDARIKVHGIYFKYNLPPSWSISDSNWITNRKYVDSVVAALGGGSQTIQQVLTTGDTATRRIYFRGAGDTTSSHTFFYNTVTPPNFGVTYTTYGMQRQYHSGYRYERGSNPSGRPNVIFSPLSYNLDPGSVTRNNTGEAAYGFYYNTHIEQGGAKLFRFEMPRMVMQDGTLYNPLMIEVNKDARSSVITGHMTAFSGYLLPASGTTLDSVMFNFTSSGHLFRTFGNGSLTLQNARNTSNSAVLSLTDNGPSMTSSGSAGSIFTFNNGVFVTHSANTSSLSLAPGNAVTTVAFNINAGTTAAGRAMENVTVNAAGVATAIYNNSNTTAANYFSHQVQSGSGRPEYVLWQNGSNYWIKRFRGNSADDSSYRLHYTATDVVYFRKDGRLGLGVGSNPAQGVVLSAVANSARTNTINLTEDFIHQTSGTAAAGFGLRKQVTLENASGTNRVAFAEDIIETGATNAAEYADREISLIRNGTLTPVARWTADGTFKINTSTISTAIDQRKLYINGSIGANKDSITLQSTNGPRHMLVLDTTSGRFERMAIPSPGGGGITSINGETGSAFTIATGNGITVATTTNTATVNLGGTLSGLTQIAGATNNLSLGTSGSKLGTLAVNAGTVSLLSDGGVNLYGSIRYLAVQHTADANHTVALTTGMLELSGASVTTDRTITLPTASVHGQVLTITLRSSGNSSHYVLSSAIEDVKTGSTFTQLDWGTTYDLMVNASLAWMVIRKY